MEGVVSARQAGSGHHGLRNKITAVVVGMATTVLTVLAGLWGWFGPYELKSYDVRMSLLNDIAASAKIVHIDIDDGSLETVGRWPWPRERLAELIETLDELGAEQIALDILLRQEEANPDKDGEATGDIRLAEAMKAAGSVLIPTHFREAVEEQERPEWWPRLRELLEENPFELEGQPLAPERVGQRLGVEPMLLAESLYRQRQEVVDDMALELLTAGKTTSALELLARYGLVGAGQGTPEYTVARKAFRRARSILSSKRFAQVPAQALAPEAFSPGHIDPPIPELAESAGSIAFIASQADVDGVFRRVPLLAQKDGYIYKQYGFFLACELLGVEDQDISFDPAGYLLLETKISGERHSVRIPVDRQSQVLINFRKGRYERWWESGFVHLPAGKVLEIPRIREKIRNNAAKRPAALREAVEQTSGLESLAEYDRLGERIRELQVRLRETATSEQTELWKTELARAQEAREKMAGEAVENITFQFKSLPSEPPKDPELLQEYQNILLFYRDLVQTDFEAENLRLAELLEETVATLKEKIGQRVCLVGSTASGGAGAAMDIVTSPVFRRVPGVVVHGNIINTILQEDFLRDISRGRGLLVVVVCGVLTSILSSLLKPLQSVALVLVALAGYLGANLAAFAAGLVLPLVMPMTAILVGFTGVMAYRQLFEAKEKRRMATALGQFTSPAVARRILAQPDLLRLSGETRVVSCYFSDLQGFTPLSERLGAEKTVSLLNRYLDRMTEVLFKHEATVNKFAGDGIFAFFGAPEVQPDHARRACLAAVDSQVALAELCQELREEGASELRMRVGINTGPAVVGNCGSSRKFDYTALGDTVNLASRLEPSNKFFGSLILVSKETFDQANLADEILSRPLGSIVAVGRSEVTEVVEILGLETQDKERTKAARAFPQGLEAYRRGQLKEALEVFESCLAVWPDDQPAKVYANLCRKGLQEPAQGKWDPTVRMTSK